MNAVYDGSLGHALRVDDIVPRLGLKTQMDTIQSTTFLALSQPSYRIANSCRAGRSDSRTWTTGSPSSSLAGVVISRGPSFSHYGSFNIPKSLTDLCLARVPVADNQSKIRRIKTDKLKALPGGHRLPIPDASRIHPLSTMASCDQKAKNRPPKPLLRGIDGIKLSQSLVFRSGVVICLSRCLSCCCDSGSEH
jgi:hypothetical protein